MLGMVKKQIETYREELRQLRAGKLTDHARARVRAIHKWAGDQMDEATGELMATTEIMAMALEGEYEIKFGGEFALTNTAWRLTEHAEVMRGLYELVDTAYYLLHPEALEGAA